MSWYFLIFSALCDAVYNVFLKRTASFHDYKNIFFVALFLAGSIVGFKKGIDGIPLGISMVVWSGVAIIGTIVLDVIIYKAKLDFKIAFFMLLCIISIIGLNYFSNK
jgi:quaternary ammonium compound-resistance protein SugE